MKTTNIRFLIMLIIYKLTLDLIYPIAITPIYFSWHYIFNFYLYKYILSTFVFMCMCIFIIDLKPDKKTSDFIVLLINIIYFVPGCTLYAFAGLEDKYFIFYVLFWILFMFFNKYIPNITFTNRLKKRNNRKLFFYIMITICIIGSVYYSFRYNGFKINLDISKSSELREEQRLMDLPVIFGYFQLTSSYITALGIIYFFDKKKYIISFLLIFGQVLSYSFGGMKTTFFLMLISVWGFLFYDKLLKNKLRNIVWIFSILNLFGIILYLVFEYYYLSGNLRRVYFSPNLISSLYYDFFSNNSPDYFRQSFLRLLNIKSEYPIPITNLMGKVYYNNVIMNANNGMVGDAIANLGWLSLLIMPLLRVIALKLIDTCSKGVEKKYLLVPVVIYGVVIYENTAFFTSILTGGMLIVCMCLYYMPRKNINGDKYLFKNKKV